MQGVGRLDPQPFIAPYSQVALAQLYARRTSVTAAALLNAQVRPFFEAPAVPLRRILTARGTEECGSPDRYEDEWS